MTVLFVTTVPRLFPPRFNVLCLPLSKHLTNHRKAPVVLIPSNTDKTAVPLPSVAHLSPLPNKVCLSWNPGPSLKRTIIRRLRKLALVAALFTAFSLFLSRSALAAADKRNELLLIRPPLTPRRREVLLIGASFITGIFTGIGFTRGKELFRRYETADDIPGHLFRRGAIIRAVVVKVSDGDTYRVRHVPMWLDDATQVMKEVKGRGGRKLSESTIVVRVAGVDTPEVAKFGRKGQVFGEEAKRYAEKRLLYKTAWIKLLSRDQYGRAVAAVSTGLLPFWPFVKDIGADLLKEGLGFVYTAAGAQYGGRETGYNYIQEQAKSNKVGLWGLPKRGVQTPGEYKARASSS